MERGTVIRRTYEEGQGILRLRPVFVPRRFGSTGRRLKLHPDDHFAYGMQRGSIKERWFSSVIPAMNGPLALPDEGMSRVEVGAGETVHLKDFVDLLGPAILGERLYGLHGTWPMYSKFFDYEDALFHHVHLDFDAAARVGKLGKPEAYFYPRQLNNYPGTFPHTYFGFSPDVTKEQVKERLRGYVDRDIRITELSRAYRIELGTGWYTPPGVIHAPGSYLTYEPQWNSDVNSVYENLAGKEIYDRSFLDENCPEERKPDLDYILSLLDWDRNVDPDYRRHYFRPPVLARETDAYHEDWISYGNPYVAAKELTVAPGAAATVADGFAYGCILVQGHGTFGGQPCETPTMLRFGQPSRDEFFVGEPAARAGVRIVNGSDVEPLVILKHFPANPETPET